MVFISVSWQLHQSAIVFAMSKVLHTTTNNWFRQFEGYFIFLNLLAASDGSFFCASYHFLSPFFSAHLSGVACSWPRRTWSESGLSWTRRSVCGHSPRPAPLCQQSFATVFWWWKIRFVVQRKREDRYWCLELKQIKATITGFRTIGSNFSDLIPEFHIVILIQRWNWIIVLSEFYPGTRLIVGDNSRSEHWNIRLRKVGNEDVEHG